MLKARKKSIIVYVIIVAILVAGLFYVLRGDKGVPKFKTEKISRGDIRETVTATGTVNAVTTVLVGTQVSGTIKTMYVDFNSAVKKGQLLAQIDPETFEAQAAQARANVSAAKANVEKSDAAFVDAERTLGRNKTLFNRNLIAKSDLDTADTNYLSAAAQLTVSKAQVKQAEAALKLAETNLKYTKIISPVDGTVISRNVDVGQTVAASFQTPTLFTIAQDLTRMQINTSIDEADIGKIRVGQPVEFGVDAYPDINFHGKVSEVRNAPTTVQNVVTYDVVVKLSNPELKLKPGMTANVSIILADKKDVLRVPDAALRFRPNEKKVEKQKDASAPKGPAVWVLENQKPRHIRIATGINDGIYTEILSGDVKEGSDVIVEETGNGRKTDSSPPRPPGFH